LKLLASLLFVEALTAVREASLLWGIPTRRNSQHSRSILAAEFACREPRLLRTSPATNLSCREPRLAAQFAAAHLGLPAAHLGLPLSSLLLTRF
jgi:hypothetical protein